MFPTLVPELAVCPGIPDLKPLTETPFPLTPECLARGRRYQCVGHRLLLLLLGGGGRCLAGGGRLVDPPLVGIPMTTGAATDRGAVAILRPADDAARASSASAPRRFASPSAAMDIMWPVDSGRA